MKTDQDIASLENEVRQATAEGHEVQEAVRQLTVRELSQSAPDSVGLRQIVGAVLRGARAGVRKELQQSAAEAQATRRQLSEAVAGLDAALAQFAGAAKLALEEAASHAREFSVEDLESTAADLAHLETMLIETLQSVAADSRDLAGEIFADLAAHFSRHGSAVGEASKNTLAAITQRVTASARGPARAGAQLVQATSSVLRQLTAEVLSRLAERIRPESGRKP
mgnify:CR=1 FL=1